jgi:GntP family gluconate:H+ symporter
MSPDRGYKTQTANTLVMGVAAILEIALLSLIFH